MTWGRVAKDSSISSNNLQTITFPKSQTKTSYTLLVSKDCSKNTNSTSFPSYYTGQYQSKTLTGFATPVYANCTEINYLAIDY